MVDGSDGHEEGQVARGGDGRQNEREPEVLPYPTARTFQTHDDQERPREGIGHMMLMPSPGHKMARAAPVQCRETIRGPAEIFLW